MAKLPSEYQNSLHPRSSSGIDFTRRGMKPRIHKSSSINLPRSSHSTTVLPAVGVSERARSVSSESAFRLPTLKKKHHARDSRNVSGLYSGVDHIENVQVPSCARNDSFRTLNTRKHLPTVQREEYICSECQQKIPESVVILLQKHGITEYMCHNCQQYRKWKHAHPQKTTLQNIGSPGATHIPAINKRTEEDLQKALMSSREENDSLRTRLSKLASANLRHNNASIADLSDGRRPTKLGEEFTQLYDNEWTDAFDSLQDSRGEASAISCLLQIVEKSYEFCCRHAERQLITFKQLLVKPASFSLETKSDERRDKLITLDAEDSLAFSELRRKLENHSLSDIQQSFRYKNHSWFGGDLTRYTEKCLELSWFMSLHSPPVVMDTLPKPGDPFNKSKYRAYTRDGARVAFVVWPAIFLHAGGPVLAKGVVQGQ